MHQPVGIRLVRTVDQVEARGDPAVPGTDHRFGLVVAVDHLMLLISGGILDPIHQRGRPVLVAHPGPHRLNHFHQIPRRIVAVPRHHPAPVGLPDQQPPLIKARRTHIPDRIQMQSLVT